MSKTLIVSYLPREGSNTKQLVDTFTETVDSEVVVRSLDDGTTPLLSETALKTWWGPAAENEVEAASSEFIAELKAADNIIIATPMYNWSMPAPMKAWFDLVIRGGKTFEFTETGPKGLLSGQKVGLFVTTGMTKLESGSDHLTPVVKTAFGMMGAGEVTVIGAGELLIVGEEEATSRMNAATEQVQQYAKSL